MLSMIKKNSTIVFHYTNSKCKLLCNKIRKEIKYATARNEDMQSYLFINSMIIYAKNSNEKSLLKLVSKHRKVAGSKANIKNSFASLYSSGHQDLKCTT